MQTRLFRTSTYLASKQKAPWPPFGESGSSLYHISIYPFCGSTLEHVEEVSHFKVRESHIYIISVRHVVELRLFVSLSHGSVALLLWKETKSKSIISLSVVESIFKHF